MKKYETLAMIFILLLYNFNAYSQESSKGKEIKVGVASIDITPEYPIRLAGFALRTQTESDTVSLPLNAKAIAFGNSYEDLSLMITVDLIGISYQITDSVKKRLSGIINPDRISISASHTHSGPEIGTLINILHFTSLKTAFDGNLLPIEQISHINKYREDLTDKLEIVALKAIKSREPSFISWGKGEVDFAMNRRGVDVVDYDMPLMKITDVKGNIKCLFLTYSCHAVCAGSNNNAIHGDWVGVSQKIIEERYPGVTALVAVGCGGDINPKAITTEEIENNPFYGAEKYGKMIADEVDNLLSMTLTPIKTTPTIKYANIELPFNNVPDTKEFIDNTSNITVKGYYSRLALERKAIGLEVPSYVKYPIQVWRFGNDLDMIVLGGEVVSEYSQRLKKELGSDKLWIIAYSNDVSCYIPSKRYIEKTPTIYEVEPSMYYYNQPSPFKSSVEDQIIKTIHSLR
ncbi:MAG: neutral/alkaline non-lysosomal ceramidase N-terminal domain-containing protein [Dysgonamonadaceae bacterium]|nr:neutral/alkaline non-lysosomal ceramidase N-terminal domain-containing protein [Dysgonamonadaceae bacterium]MDD4727354.1 neutral/alkaline non-lysosomal ceramidase N-terminal domain-containing protein [Dysgonamonadaceae bacterium]